MKKLTKNNTPQEFHDCAHNLILMKKGRFSITDIIFEMFEHCEKDVSLNMIKPILFEELEHCIESGFIAIIDEYLYENKYIEKDLTNESTL